MATVPTEILLRTEKILPAQLTSPLYDRWQTDQEDDTVDILLQKAAEIADAGVYLRPATVRADENGTIYLDNIPFPSPLITEKFTPLSGKTVVAYVVTCGAALWNVAQGEMKDDFFAAAIWDDIMLAYLRLAGDLAHKTAAALFADVPHIAALNPGSLPAWDIYGQKDLFALLGDGADRLGVALSPSMLMLPTKSTSGIYFATEEPYENCQRCPRVDCPNRRAAYIEE